MKNRISEPLEDSSGKGNDANEGAHRIDEVLEALFTQYERRFPSTRIVVVETPVSAI